MKKLFALLAVASLAAVGCNDNKTTSKTNAGTGGTYERKDTVRVDTHATVTDTVLRHTGTETNTNTVRVTVTKDVTPKGGPGLPDGKKPGDGK